MQVGGQIATFFFNPSAKIIHVLEEHASLKTHKPNDQGWGQFHLTNFRSNSF